MVLMTDDEPTREPLTCVLCDARLGDGHWSNCPLAPKEANADTDPDADIAL